MNLSPIWILSFKGTFAHSFWALAEASIAASSSCCDGYVLVTRGCWLCGEIVVCVLFSIVVRSGVDNVSAGRAEVKSYGKWLTVKVVLSYLISCVQPEISGMQRTLLVPVKAAQRPHTIPSRTLYSCQFLRERSA